VYNKGVKIFIGADHRGFALKQALYKHLIGHGHEVTDVGAHGLNTKDDYPDFALKVAQGVAQHAGSYGILLCGSGMGMDVVANKVRGVRATVGYSADSITHARSHDDINVLTLAADVLAPHDAEAFVELFLITPFGGDERNVRRLKKIAAIEEDNFK
jgi:ribose 5-phosphate isomerase B